jgi:NADH:ubiquinone oxidoreductase subunit 3 (subunit A)
MNNIWLSPPITFIVFLAIIFGCSLIAGKMAAKGNDSPSKTKSYACGETEYASMGQPDYSQFFKFAFFFTIMHVMVLILATVPSGMSVMAALYFIIAVVALLILFRK